MNTPRRRVLQLSRARPNNVHHQRVVDSRQFGAARTYYPAGRHSLYSRRNESARRQSASETKRGSAGSLATAEKKFVGWLGLTHTSCHCTFCFRSRKLNLACPAVRPSSAVRFPKVRGFRWLIEQKLLLCADVRHSFLS